MERTREKDDERGGGTGRDNYEGEGKNLSVEVAG